MRSVAALLYLFLLLLMTACQEKTVSVVNTENWPRDKAIETTLNKRDTLFFDDSSCVIADLTSAGDFYDREHRQLELFYGRFFCKIRSQLRWQGPLIISNDKVKINCIEQSQFAITVPRDRSEDMRITVYEGQIAFQVNGMNHILSAGETYYAQQSQLSKMAFADWKKDSSWLHGEYFIKSISLYDLSNFLREVRDTNVFIRCPDLDTVTVNDISIRNNTLVYNVINDVERQLPTIMAEAYRKFQYTLGYREKKYCGY